MHDVGDSVSRLLLDAVDLPVHARDDHLAVTVFAERRGAPRVERVDVDDAADTLPVLHDERSHRARVPHREEVAPADLRNLVAAVHDAADERIAVAEATADAVADLAAVVRVAERPDGGRVGAEHDRAALALGDIA